MSLTESLAEWINTTKPIHSIDQVVAGNLGIILIFSYFFNLIIQKVGVGVLILLISFFMSFD